MTSSIGSISFPVAQPDSTVSRPFRQTTKKITEGGKVKDVFEAWIDFGDGVSQVSTLTIASGTVGNEYIVEISDGEQSSIVSYKQKTGDTANIIAENLVQEINGVPSATELVSATLNNNVITITGDIPGTAITLNVSASTTPANLVVAQTTPASGTSKMRKIAELKVYFDVPTGGRNLVAITQSTFYDGGNPASVVRPNPEVKNGHPQSMESLSASVNA